MSRWEAAALVTSLMLLLAIMIPLVFIMLHYVDEHVEDFSIRQLPALSRNAGISNGLPEIM
jgi:hypothetical protein